MKTKFFLCYFIVIFIGIFLWFQGYRWNKTPSVPKGIWKISNEDIKNINAHVGRYFLVYAPKGDAFNIGKERKYLTGIFNYRPMIKKVMGIPGDHVTLSNYVYINGKKINNSIIFQKDSKNRSLPKSNDCIVQPDAVWVISDSQYGFDSRYFGSIPISNVKGFIDPVWVWK